MINLSSEQRIARAAKARLQFRTHGLTGTPEYRAWKAMNCRCNDKRNSDYGGRGISVCAEWSSFTKFLADMGPKPSPRHSIERIENNGNYEPGNCKWATRAEQIRNRSNSVRLVFDGRVMSLMDWASEIGIGFGTLWARINGSRYSRKWTIAEALTTPLRRTA